MRTEYFTKLYLEFEIYKENEIKRIEKQQKKASGAVWCRMLSFMKIYVGFK